MFYVDNPTGVPVMPEPSPVNSLTDLFFTEGGNGVPPTYPGPDWFNIVQSELLNIVREAGLDPDKMTQTQVLDALKKLFLQRQNPFSDIKADGAAAVAMALANLGLKEAAKRNVGTGTNQIPDMSSFTFNASSAAFPGGLQFRFGRIAASGAKYFSTPFPNACLGIAFGLEFSTINQSWTFTGGYDVGTLAKNGFNWRANCCAGGGAANQAAGENFYYFAWGN